MENIKREDLAAKGYTEEQITDILNTYHKMGEEVKKANEAASQSKTLADGLQKQIDDINKANMTEQEKLEEMKKETALKLADAKKTYNTAKVKEILAGYEVEDDIISKLIDEDETASLNNANLFKNRLDTIIANTTKKTREAITSVDVKPAASNVPQDAGMTFDKFGELSVEEQEKFIAEHPTEYKNMMS